MAPHPPGCAYPCAACSGCCCWWESRGLVCTGLYIAFEWGRSNAGFDGRDARRQRAALRDQIGELEAENRRLRLQFASQQTDHIGQIRERTELARSIGDLQAELAQVSSDLAFYRSLAGEKAGESSVLKVQQFRVTRGTEANQYLMRLVLGRPMGREDPINGRIRMTLEGTTAATPVNLDLAVVSDVDGGELLFNYRYSQTIDIPIQLPPGFTPVRTAMEITPSRKGVNPVRTSFAWTVEN